MTALRRRKTGFSNDVHALILARSGGHCEIMVDKVCVLVAETVHHRKPRGMGGSRRDGINDADNGLAACRVCHQIVEVRREWAYENGFLVRRSKEPSDVPVWWRHAMMLFQGRRVKKMILLDKGGQMREVGYGGSDVEP